MLIMGREQVSWHVLGTVSRHNSAQDHDDDELWEELTVALSATCDNPKFASLNLIDDGIIEAGERYYG
jgi:hypothetical protein